MATQTKNTIEWVKQGSEAMDAVTQWAVQNQGNETAALGVSGFSLEEVHEANRILGEHGLALAGVRNHFSLIDRSAEEEGILSYCKENDIPFYAEEVTEGGSLTGKVRMDTPLKAGAPGATDINPLLDRISVLLVEMERVAAAHGVDASLIPAAWVFNKGLIPVGYDPEALKDLILTVEEQEELESLATYLIVAA